MYEYPFGNGQQLNLDWFLAEWKNLLAAWEAEKNGIEGALQAEIDRAEAALADVFAARDAAAQSAANALESKNAAAQSASDASGYLATVRADANTASNAARNAAQSETAAGNSASAAAQSEANALQSKNAAAQSEANADASKSAAAQSAADADASKSAAAQSAADADASKSAAAQSASDAEDAAESVEASAQQIAINTSDISDLKISVANKLLTPFDMWANRFLASSETTIRNRRIKLEKNHIMLTRLGNSTGGQGLSLLTGENFAISESNMSSITYNANQYLALDTFEPIKEYTDLYANFGVYNPESDIGTNGIILQFVSIDDNENVLYISTTGIYATNTRVYGYARAIKKPAEATHFGLFYITRRCVAGMPTDIVFTLNPHISDPVATSLALAN